MNEMNSIVNVEMLDESKDKFQIKVIDKKKEWKTSSGTEKSLTKVSAKFIKENNDIFEEILSEGEIPSELSFILSDENDLDDVSSGSDLGNFNSKIVKDGSWKLQDITGEKNVENDSLHFKTYKNNKIKIKNSKQLKSLISVKRHERREKKIHEQIRGTDMRSTDKYQSTSRNGNQNLEVKGKDNSVIPKAYKLSNYIKNEKKRESGYTHSKKSPGRKRKSKSPVEHWSLAKRSLTSSLKREKFKNRRESRSFYRRSSDGGKHSRSSSRSLDRRKESRSPYKRKSRSPYNRKSTSRYTRKSRSSSRSLDRRKESRSPYPRKSASPYTRKSRSPLRKQKTKSSFIRKPVKIANRDLVYSNLTNTNLPLDSVEPENVNANVSLTSLSQDLLKNKAVNCEADNNIMKTAPENCTENKGEGVNNLLSEISKTGNTSTSNFPLESPYEKRVPLAESFQQPFSYEFFTGNSLEPSLMIPPKNSFVYASSDLMPAYFDRDNTYSNPNELPMWNFGPQILTLPSVEHNFYNQGLHTNFLPAIPINSYGTAFLSNQNNEQLQLHVDSFRQPLTIQPRDSGINFVEVAQNPQSQFKFSESPGELQTRLNESTYSSHVKSSIKFSDVNCISRDSSPNETNQLVLEDAVVNKIQSAIESLNDEEYLLSIFGRFILREMPSIHVKSDVENESPLNRDKIQLSFLNLHDEKQATNDNTFEEISEKTFKFLHEKSVKEKLQITRLNESESVIDSSTSSVADFSGQCDFTTKVITDLNKKIYDLRNELNKLKNTNANLLDLYRQSQNMVKRKNQEESKTMD